MSAKLPEADSKALARHAEVTEQLRQRILKGQYEPGSRLPTLHKLAEEFDTSYFTVQTALKPLAEQGLIERRRRTGTVVSPNVNVVTRVGIYCGREFLDDWNFAFFRALCRELQSQLSERGIEARLYMDVRAEAQQASPPDDLAQSLDSRAVQALFVVLGGPKSHRWLNKVEVPVSSVGADPKQGGVVYSSKQMLELAFERLQQRGCQRVGMISSIVDGADDRNGYGAFYAHAVAVAEKLGLELPSEWIQKPKAHPELLEAFGYDAFQALWRDGEHPDGLFVFPDTAARGVMTGMLEQGLRVPADLAVVSHGNKGVEWTCPLAFDWVSADVGKWAEAMIEEVLRQKEGQEPSCSVLSYEMEVAE